LVRLRLGSERQARHYGGRSSLNGEEASDAYGEGRSEIANDRLL
jgi:hypothetical protein